MTFLLGRTELSDREVEGKAHAVGRSILLEGLQGGNGLELLSIRANQGTLKEMQGHLWTLGKMLCWQRIQIVLRGSYW